MKQTYLQQLNNRRFVSKFNLLYQSIINRTQLFPQLNVQNVQFKNKNLNLILQQIQKPQYIVCQSGDIVKLEQAMFWDQQRLITQGVLETVFGKIKNIVQKIKQGISSVIKQSSQKIKAFCQKVKNNSIVQAIIKKLELEQKVSAQKYKKFIKVKDSNGEVVEQSSICIKNGFIICQATKLNKKQAALTDPKQIQKHIQKWQKAAKGQQKINSKTGKPLSTKYCKAKIALFKKLLNSVGKDGDKKQQKKILGQIHINTQGISNYTTNVRQATTKDDTMKIVTKNVSISVGGDDVKQVITGNGQSDGSSQQKKSMFGKLKDKVAAGLKKANQKANQLGNKAKQKIQKASGKIKQWYGKQNKWVKMLIWLIIGVLACLAIYGLIVSFVMPLIYGLMHGGIVNAAVGAFRIYASGKTFIKTFQAGKKAWDSGEGWGKFFLLCIGSVLAALNLKQMADQGAAMMAADQARDAGVAAKTGQQVTKSASVGKKAGNAFDLNGDGRLSHREVMKLFKDNKIPNIDLNDPRYAGVGGYYNFQQDLIKNPEFQQVYGKLDPTFKNHFWSQLESDLKRQACTNMGIKSSNFSGHSWWHKAIGADSSEAEAAAAKVAKAMGN